MASCKCGGAQCNCVIVAGRNTTVTGAGSTSNPYVVSATTPVTGCGLDGAGTAADPLAVVPSAQWADLYACPIDTSAGNVFCDPATGALHTDPPPRQDFFTNSKNDVPATPIPVPTATQQTVDTLTITITNPDPCRRARVIFFREVDLDVNLLPGSGAATGIDNDDMSYLGNQGNATVFNTHVQENKISSLGLAPGETQTITMNIQAGRGSGGAEITRIQATLRAWVFSNVIG